MKYIIAILIILLLIYLYNMNSCNCSFNRDINEDFDISNLNNKKTLILYWATWCHHCKIYMATWDELKDKYGNQIEFKEVEHKNMTSNELSKVSGFPAIIYIDENGKETKIKNRNNIPVEIKLKLD